MSKIKQVIIIHYTLPPVIGGVENMLKPLAEQLAQHDYIVTFMAGRGGINSTKIKTTLIPELDPGNTKIAKMQRQINTGTLPEHYHSKVKEIEKKIETRIGYIDNIIIHNMMTMPFNLAATEALWNFIQKYPDKNYYIWTHDLAWQMDCHQDKLYNRPPWDLLKRKIPQADYITVSNYRQRQISKSMKINKSRIKIIPNVIKFQDFLKYNNFTSKIISQLSIYNRFPVILLPVKIIPRKNIERSINIIANLKRYYPDMIALITGNFHEKNIYYQKIKNLVEKKELENNIIFLQKILDDLEVPSGHNPKIVRDLYFVCHLVLYLSNDEGFGIPLLEAAAARVPIVLSDLQVFKEIAQDEAVYLPNTLDQEEAAERLKNIIDMKVSYLNLNMRITRHYNWDFWWNRYLKNIFK
ncbi:MAG: glycosyltransferase [Candidatus Marinimicrobia bacterium]|nr:glycosyltransferase [Candidatus Neomarinimicrobiota bacterium]